MGRSPVTVLSQYVGDRRGYRVGTGRARADADRGPRRGDTFGLTTLIGALLGALNVSTDYNAAVQGLLLLGMLGLRATLIRRRAQ